MTDNLIVNNCEVFTQFFLRILRRLITLTAFSYVLLETYKTLHKIVNAKLNVDERN